jgi:hypothetical protein
MCNSSPISMLIQFISYIALMHQMHLTRPILSSHRYLLTGYRVSLEIKMSSGKYLPRDTKVHSFTWSH